MFLLIIKIQRIDANIAADFAHINCYRDLSLLQSFKLWSITTKVVQLSPTDPNKYQQQKDWQQVAHRIHHSLISEKFTFYRLVLDIITLKFIKKLTLKIMLPHLIKKIDTAVLKQIEPAASVAEVISAPIIESPPMTRMQFIKKMILKIVPSCLIKKIDAIVSKFFKNKETAVSNVAAESLVLDNEQGLSEDQKQYVTKLVAEFYSTVKPDPYGGDVVRAGKLLAFFRRVLNSFSEKQISPVSAFGFIKKDEALTSTVVQGLKKFGRYSWGTINNLLGVLYKENVCKQQLAIFCQSCPEARSWDQKYIIDRLGMRDTQAVAKYVFAEVQI